MLAAGWVILGSPGAVPVRGVRIEPVQGGEPLLVDVKAGDTAETIGERLAAAKIIDSANSFGLLARASGAERKLQAGEYEFAPGTSVLDALARIHDGLTAARIVTVREGLRIEEIAALLERRGVVTAIDFLAASRALAPVNNNSGASLIAGRPAGASLEGYLYPASYSFPRTITAQDVVASMVKALAERFTPDLEQEARAQGLTPHDALTLASIVEREAVFPDERPLIASVYLNRLREGMPLQADPTVQYAVARQAPGLDGYWKRELMAADLKVDSPYNTYVRSGLPPTPICSPGIDSVLAVIRPAKTDYLFFVARPDGRHAFSRTFDEHERNVERYQRP